MSQYLDLIVPGLCGPLPEITSFQEDKSILSFSNYLSKAIRQTALSKNYPRQLCDSLNIEFDTDKLPFAEFALAAYGIEAEEYYWMHADPVHLMADVDHVILYDSNSLDLSLSEAQDSVKALNDHFIQDGFEFVIADSNHWFVRSKKPFDVDSFHLQDVVMRNINQFFPTGEGSRFLKRIINESQMLLHANSVNSGREDRGLLPVNSLWFWGEGKIRSQVISDSVKCAGDDVLLTGIAKHFNFSMGSIDDGSFMHDFKMVSSNDSDERRVVVFDELITSSNYGDVSTWLADFNRLYAIKLKPFIEEMMKNKIQIHLYPCNGYRYILDSKMIFRFWRRGKLDEYFEVNNSQA